MPMYKVPVEQAVGLTLGYDITKIVPGEEKYRAFQKGHVITSQDIAKLKDMGKEHIYIWEATPNMIHEDEAALRLAQISAGEGLFWTEPSQGRVNIKAKHPGLLKVNIERLNALNSLDDVIMATLHNNRVVAEGQVVAGTRVVPVEVETKTIDSAESICCGEGAILAIKPFMPLRVALVTTGTEVSSGRIKDGSELLIKEKIKPFEGQLIGQVIVPDDSNLIAEKILYFIGQGAQLVLVSGGMSVDADDATPLGIRHTGARVVFYGAPILPGSQFMLAYHQQVPICGIPGGALFSPHTTLDLLLPRVFAGEMISRQEIVAMGHGGLCEGCQVCHFPQCPFGKAT